MGKNIKARNNGGGVSNSRDQYTLYTLGLFHVVIRDFRGLNKDCRVLGHRLLFVNKNYTTKQQSLSQTTDHDLCSTHGNL